MKKLLLIMLVVCILPFIGQAQKGNGNKSNKGKPPAQEQPVVVPTHELPSELVIRNDQDQIFKIGVSPMGEATFIYYDYSAAFYDAVAGGYQGQKVDSGTFNPSRFRAIRVGNKVTVQFSYVRGTDPTRLQKPPVEINGIVDIELVDGVFSTFLSHASGTVDYQVTDPTSDFRSAIIHGLGCLTTQFAALFGATQCAIGLPPGVESHIPTH